jgi:hypothetical protein
VQVKNAQTAAELASNAAREAGKFSGPRIRNYVDAGGEATRAFAPSLRLEPRLGVQLPAWDVYLAYGSNARWEQTTPPPPAYWMHQLSNAPPELKLNADRFRQAVQDLLPKQAAGAALISEPK